MGNIDEKTSLDKFPLCPKCGYRFTLDLEEYSDNEDVESECPDCETKLTIRKIIMVQFETSIK